MKSDWREINKQNEMKPRVAMLLGVVFFAMGSLFVIFNTQFMMNFFIENGMTFDSSSDSAGFIFFGAFFAIIGLRLFIYGLVKYFKEKNAPTKQEYILQPNGLYNRIEIIKILHNNQNEEKL